MQNSTSDQAENGSAELHNSSAPKKQSPMMVQYWDIKSAHEDKIVLFRMGDFFEIFHRDAEIAAPVLGIALTSRNKNSADQIPMCGVPHHSIANSINKLLAQGFKIAICDQIEDPKLAKGLVKRAVTRILSPGVVYDPDTLDSLKPNYLASFDEKSVSFMDTTTGEAFFFDVADEKRRAKLIDSLQPVEIIVSSASPIYDSGSSTLVTIHEPLGPVVRNWPVSARRLIAYATHMQGEKVLETITPFERRELSDRMELPGMVLRHLEVFSTYKGDTQGTLFRAIDRCKTSSGSRLLKQWIQFPLASQPGIERRLERVEAWTKSQEKLKELRSVLAHLGDIQRRLGKLGNPSCHPRDLVSLADSLRAGLDATRIAASTVQSHEWNEELITTAEEVSREILATLVDEPPLQFKNGGIIRSGVAKELDELIELSTNSHQLIMELEAREKEATGIGSLKVRFNNVFGYYIEITNTHKDKVPSDRYERKQTLANAERYLTKELGELESKVLSAQSKRLELETAIFAKLTEKCLKKSQPLLRLAGAWSELDVLSALAHLAIEENYVRPKFSEAGNIDLKGSRHPVIEQALSLPFVANDIALPRKGCLLLTGPNMAGKSTLMRQVAVSAILAQSGSFVPAREATLPIFDRIFTRIGASDFLAEGLSTFMVEMKETAEMLESVTDSSLVVLDEVGRGTSTYDGMSLAQAILEFLIESRGSMTFFATHYHELTELESRYPLLINGHMSIHERVGPKGSEITFLHQLSKGPANKSYGIHVAKLAGLPPGVLKRATGLLKKLEANRVEPTGQMSLLGQMDVAADDDMNLDSLPVESPEDQQAKLAIEAIRGLDISKLTPLEALNQIAKWQQSLF